MKDVEESCARLKDDGVTAIEKSGEGAGVEVVCAPELEPFPQLLVTAIEMEQRIMQQKPARRDTVAECCYAGIALPVS